MFRQGTMSVVATMQNAAAATGNGTALQCNSEGGNTDGQFKTAVLQVTGTFVGTVTFEATVDNTNWVATGMTSLADESTVATTATAPIIVRKNIEGISQLRARVSAYTSGSITVIGQMCA